jgi:hypothetical protein
MSGQSILKDCHYVREKVQSNKIDTLFVKSENQLVDILTKGLSAKVFEDILCKLGLFDLYNSNLKENAEK